MPLVTLEEASSGARARIHSDLAFNCFDYSVPIHGERIEVLEYDPGFAAGEAKPRAGGIPLLFPFPNRIKGAKYTWRGREYALKPHDQFGNAIHGLISDRSWRVIAQTRDAVTGEFQLSKDAPDLRALWPADFRIRVSYQLVGGCLKSRIVVFNPDSVPLPWGFGTHPYFKVPLKPGGDAGKCLIEVPAKSIWELVDCVPTGKIVPVDPPRDLRSAPALSTLKLDDVYTDVTMEHGCCRTRIVDEAAGMQVLQVSDSLFREQVVYTPPHGKSVCIEPYTCTTDAVNLTERGIPCGLQVLEPGQETTTWIDIKASALVC
jgi:aldose 1-epimerase